MPKVHLYDTFLGGLRHSPPQMKNQRGSMRKKNHISLSCTAKDNILAIKLQNEIAFCVPIPIWYECRVVPAFPAISRNEKIAGKIKISVRHFSLGLTMSLHHGVAPV
jgi:hypothetical protein